MASGIDLGPVPELEGHRLESLHLRSRSWGQVGTGILCAGLFFGAGALGRAALSARTLPAPARTVTVCLAEEAPVPPAGDPARFDSAPPPVAATAEPGADSRLQQAAPAWVPAAAAVLPVSSSDADGSGLGAVASPNASGTGLGHGGAGHGKGGMHQGGGTGSGASAGMGLQAGIDPGALYRATLASWLASRKRYPAAARNQGRQGEVLLALEIDPQGQLTQVRLERSSGHALLDQAALSLVKTCGALPPPPPGLRQIRVSVDYSLA